MRRRPQIKVKEVIRFLSQFDDETKVFIAPSMLNLDEPPKTQEFIDWERKVKCVAIEHCEGEITFGWEEK